MEDNEKDERIAGLEEDLRHEKLRTDRLREQRRNMGQLAARLTEQLESNECTRGHVENSVRLLQIPAKEGKKAGLEAIITFGFESAGMPGLRIDLPIFKRADNDSVFASNSIGTRYRDLTCESCNIPLPVIPPAIEVTRELQDFAISLYEMALSQQKKQPSETSVTASAQYQVDQRVQVNLKQKATLSKPLRIL